MERKLYEASLSGSVATLNMLMEEDELILDRVSVTCFDETPLHIAALRGHLDFTRAVASRKPKLAMELDWLGRSPLHLAAAEGHADVVRELLPVSGNAGYVRDQDGRTPLHLAAMKGRVEVMSELIRAQPKSAYETSLDRGETVLHLCVRYNRLEALKLLVEYTGQDDKFVNSRDHDGNTVLHLAVALKLMEVVKFLCSVRVVKEHANAKNALGLTAFEVLDNFPRDLKVMEIREFLMEAGIGRRRSSSTNIDLTTVLHHPSSPNNESNDQMWTISDYFPLTVKKAWNLLCIIWKNYLHIEDDWLEGTRGNLMVAATLTATVSFQAGLSPPGSVWQDLDATHHNHSAPQPGRSILDTEDPKVFRLFLKYNTVTFVASLCIILLLISGFPLKNKLPIWLLTAAMSVALTFMALTYIISVPMTTSDNSWDTADNMSVRSIFVWMGLCAFVVMLHTANFMVMLAKTLKMCVPKGWVVV